ncbi:MAG: helix-turn-helix domain-containing protein [Candidatus Omnitrophota bacterium]
MKRHEVILKAMSGEFNWIQAAEILGITDRQMRRVRLQYRVYGVDGLLDRRQLTPSCKRVPYALAERVLRLYREKYFDFNITHFHLFVCSGDAFQLVRETVSNLFGRLFPEQAWDTFPNNLVNVSGREGEGVAFAMRGTSEIFCQCLFRTYGEERLRFFILG